MKRTVTLIISVLVVANLNAQRLLTKTEIAQYYSLGIKYKDGVGVPMDYEKAVYFFTQGARSGDVQSTYALAYMNYKGLGCTQDYYSAANLFAEGAFIGKSNSMYFYGLCLRNGYGVAKNEDSARYWLKRSAKLGYRQAVQELGMTVPENSNDSAKAMVQQINNAAIPPNTTINRFQKADHQLPLTASLNGAYTGYLIQYDWSGQNVVNSKKLDLDIDGRSPLIEGHWKEEGIERIAFQALLTHDSVVFKNTSYARNDHYSPMAAIEYNFQSARLNIIQVDDSVFIAGNVEMFSPDRKEPSKPLFVVLARIIDKNNVSASDLHVSPNPFISNLNVEFNLEKKVSVEVELLSANGTIVYRNVAGYLSAGHYILPLQPGNVAPGIYIVKLVRGNCSETVKVVNVGS